ncbi:MAG: TauD/TfdA family dioxygenase [Acidobacteriota bacterium]
MSYFDPEKRLPLVIEPSIDNINLIAWAKKNREFIETQLLKHGAILFRGFRVKSVEDFEQFVNTVSGTALEYNERSSPRSQVSGNVYTSTDYPANQSIFLHNEQSYNLTFPLRIFFFCVTPAQEGGETPIADTRKIFQRLSSKVKERFMEKSYMYVRNFTEGLGLSWQTAFQATDRTLVEEYCRNNKISVEWKDCNRLKTRQVRRVVAKHPRSGEMAWFNHLTFFHISTLDQSIREKLLEQFHEEELPNNTYYGDASIIEQSVLDELSEAYQQEAIIFPWQEMDILMLDNILTAHGRKSYSGQRKILVAMTELCRWDDV